jgi:UDP-N-acetylglucosamine/UDP-N-acetylgalactosamine diphosphorylase
MVTIPDEIRQRLRKARQEHVLAWWDKLDFKERRQLLEQLQAIDFSQLQELFGLRDKAYSLPSPEKISPAPVVRLGTDDRDARRLGEEALTRGEVAVLVVAGGQGSRLGFEHPKGMFPISPVKNKSLFQIHCEKVLALNRRYGKKIPFLVMTSPATHAETEAYFRQKRYFGLPADDVLLFRQGTMPALDITTGKLLLEKPGRLFTSPNGHGGTLTALADSGILDRLRQRGIRDIFYLQVDNPLVKLADPVFLGHHRAAQAEVSSKAVCKEGPADKLGNFVVIDGSCCIIEYSDLPEALGRQIDEAGQLRIWAGSVAIHIFRLDFLARVTQGQIPYHIARKKVPYLDETGQLVQPTRENAFKFEMFIFDVLPLAERWTLVETQRAEEFVPLKNASGPDSPEAVRQALSNLAAEWLEKAGVHVPRHSSRDAAVPLEISPLFALDAEELKAKVKPGLQITGPTYLE